MRCETQDGNFDQSTIDFRGQGRSKEDGREMGVIYLNKLYRFQTKEGEIRVMMKRKGGIRILELLEDLFGVFRSGSGSSQITSDLLSFSDSLCRTSTDESQIQ